MAEVERESEGLKRDWSKHCVCYARKGNRTSLGSSSCDIY